MKKNKPLGLHIATDFPGPYSPSSVTVAIRDFVSGTSDIFDSAILIPRRIRKPSQTEYVRIENKLHVRLFDPIATMLPGVWQHFDWVNLIETNLLNSVKPNFVHSHKLTYEARIGDILAKHYNIPHIITIRGSSDTHTRNHWPWTAHTYKNILIRSHTNLWLSMWAKSFIHKKTGYESSEKDICFANAVPATIPNTTDTRKLKRNSFVCICRLNDYRQKGILELLRGVASARLIIPDLTLDLIGPCNDSVRRILDAVISKYSLSKNVSLLGPMARNEIIEKMSSYAAMVLLSKNESFGLVYAEALLSGIPIIYLRESGVDGYDFAEEYGIACDDLSVASVQTALVEMSTRQNELREKIRVAHSYGKLDCLMSNGQAKLYSGIVTYMLNN